MTSRHQPVMVDEVTVQLSPLGGRIYLDGTCGAGGHAEEILKESDPDGRLVALDVDREAYEATRFRLSRYGKRVSVFRESYADFPAVLDAVGVGQVDGMLLDLGLSSMQLDSPERGFSFQQDAPLDMRMDDRLGVTAEYVVNEVSRDQLRRILSEFGEEPRAWAIADRIVERRRRGRIATTGQLAALVEEVIPRRGRKIHPATRTFQAIRMEVNRELDNLRRFLDRFPERLRRGGRLVVISFHSLEDRLVKERFRELAAECVCPPEVPVCVCGAKKQVKILTKKPVTPDATEVRRNPRCRSAKLRAVEKV